MNASENPHKNLDAGTVLASPIKAVLQAAVALGANRDELLRATGIDSEALRASDARFPVAQLFTLYRLAESATGDHDLGLSVGRVAFINGLNLQLYMSTLCSTFREYLNLMPSVLKFAGDIGEVKITRQGDLIRLEWQPLLPASADERYLSDAFLVNSAAIVNSLCIQAIQPIKAEFTYARPDNTKMLEQTFGDNLAFSRPVSCLYYPHKCLNYPLTELDVELHQAQTAPLQNLFEEPPTEDLFLASLRQTLMRLLPAGEMSIDKVSSELNVSRRTLQRRLTQRDTQFLQVLQTVRAELAIRYLNDERLGLSEIAFLLGYSDQAAFSHAFKTWHGLAPSDFRRSS